MLRCILVSLKQAFIFSRSRFHSQALVYDQGSKGAQTHLKTSCLRSPEETCWLFENPGNYVERNHLLRLTVGHSTHTHAFGVGHSPTGGGLVAGTTGAGQVTLAYGTLQEAGSSGQRGHGLKFLRPAPVSLHLPTRLHPLKLLHQLMTVLFKQRSL